ncbi:transporter [Rhizobium sp. TRM95796]|uniref:transporter n=1 Tax=Rhizobium sp. TRM95796 TaxID=2979862 RepID=UPI0021E881B2|nr:transporter [Rhizobium sp. TRM95796]MCV3766354.1 transporter [Rhizobium sp. TRM95796]
MELPVSAIPGFVWATRFEPESGASIRLPPETELDALLSQSGFHWLHLGLSDARVPHLLERIPDLPPEAVQALTSRDAHATLSVLPEIVCGTIIDLQRGFDEMTSEIGWLHFAITDRMIITTRLHPLRSIDRARQALEKNSARISGPMDVFSTLVIEFQRTVMAMAQEINEELNRIEDFVYENAERDERHRLAPARRSIVKLYRHLRTELALLRRAAASDDDEAPEGFQEIAQKLTERIEVVERDVFSLQERARLLHEDIDSRAQAETNRHLYILSLLTAFLMPPTLVTGFFGMNTENLPFAHTEGGTFFAGVLITLSIGAAWMLLKKARIL